MDRNKIDAIGKAINAAIPDSTTYEELLQALTEVLVVYAANASYTPPGTWMPRLVPAIGEIINTAIVAEKRRLTNKK